MGLGGGASGGSGGDGEGGGGENTIIPKRVGSVVRIMVVVGLLKCNTMVEVASIQFPGNLPDMVPFRFGSKNM